eukprot:TRINITY_DN2516_c0_g1_i1.p2 TRINITY_DN2516_c0_g1~~TRINITY_DN2516_c0_g1_i1.p2  ORF type:complete len:149 (-),score=17.31 TRINITY_DN2516_c0_g1_i1:262-708(-)
MHNILSCLIDVEGLKLDRQYSAVAFHDELRLATRECSQDPRLVADPSFFEATQPPPAPAARAAMPFVQRWIWLSTCGDWVGGVEGGAPLADLMFLCSPLEVSVGRDEQSSPMRLVMSTLLSISISRGPVYRTLFEPLGHDNVGMAGFY